MVSMAIGFLDVSVGTFPCWVDFENIDCIFDVLYTILMWFRPPMRPSYGLKFMNSSLMTLAVVELICRIIGTMEFGAMVMSCFKP